MTDFDWEKVLTNYPVRGRGSTSQLKRRVVEQLGNRKRFAMKRLNRMFASTLSIGVAIIVAIFAVKGVLLVQSNRTNIPSQLGSQTWKPSPMFTLPVNMDSTVDPSTGKTFVTGSHTIPMQFEGFKGNIALSTQFPITTGIQKYLWYFWGKGLTRQQEVSITAISQARGQRIQVARGITLGGRDGSTATFGTEMSFPSSGLWEINVTVADKHFEQLIVNVGQRGFDQTAAYNKIRQLKPQFFQDIRGTTVVKADDVANDTFDVTITEQWQSHGTQQTHFWQYRVTPTKAQFLRQGGDPSPQNVPL